MVIEYFNLCFSFFSKPKNYYEPDSGKTFKKFDNVDLDRLLGTSSTLHFNVGGINFFTQHGPAGYAFWTQSFHLSQEEINECNDNHNEALTILLSKVKAFLEKNVITREDIMKIEEDFDCRCELVFMVPRIHGVSYTLNSEDMKFMADYDLDFHYWPVEQKQLLILQRTGSQ